MKKTIRFLLILVLFLICNTSSTVFASDDASFLDNLVNHLGLKSDTKVQGYELSDKISSYSDDTIELACDNCLDECGELVTPECERGSLNCTICFSDLPTVSLDQETEL
jgi:hypothetical protein